jgi:hypothetical protein
MDVRNVCGISPGCTQLYPKGETLNMEATWKSETSVEFHRETLNMEATWKSETSVEFYQTVRTYVPEDRPSIRGRYGRP